MVYNLGLYREAVDFRFPHQPFFASSGCRYGESTPRSLQATVGGARAVRTSAVARHWQSWKRKWAASSHAICVCDERNNSRWETSGPRPHPRFFASCTICICDKNPKKRQQKCGRHGRRGQGRNAVSPSICGLRWCDLRRFWIFREIAEVFTWSSNIFRRKSERVVFPWMKCGVASRRCFLWNHKKVERADGGMGVWGKDSVRPSFLVFAPSGVYGGGFIKTANDFKILSKNAITRQSLFRNKLWIQYT